MEESLVTRRSKRSTAGNRMEAALAEFRAEELGQDAEEDNDFTMEVDEQDAFESDFESTDEEGAQEDVDASAEKMVREEEKRVKKTGRSQLDKITAAAHERQKATFHPDVTTADESKVPAASKVKRRVSMGVVVDAETGAVVESVKRHSQRRHTMLNTSLADLRARDELEKKSTVPRRTKVKIRPPTQAELIARALDMEEGNVNEHRNYLALEEEKRKRARLVRTAVEGPLLRYVSKVEEAIVEVERPPAQVPAPPPTTIHYGYPFASSSQLPTGYPQPPSQIPTSSDIHQSNTPSAGPLEMTFIHYSQASGSGTPLPSWPVIPPPAHQPQPPPERIEVVETVARNYVVHETSQEEGATRPLWKDTMAAMFGDHVKWEELRVYSNKGRPLSRPQEVCPITGRLAKYRDPRSGVPYADVTAFKTLTKVLSHDFIWSESLGCYVSSREDESKLSSDPSGSS